MDEDQLKICAGPKRMSDLKDELNSLMYTDTYCDTTMICSDGKFGANSLVVPLLLPGLAYHLPHHTLILPHHSIQEVKTAISCSLYGVVGVQTRASSNQEVVDEVLGREDEEEYLPSIDFKDGGSPGALDHEEGAEDLEDEAWEPQQADLLTSKYQKKKVKVKSRSTVWKFFARAEEEKESATCILCETKIRTKKGCTTSMLRHLKLKHPDYINQDQRVAERDPGSRWIDEFASHHTQNSISGHRCKLCDKFFKTSAIGITGLVNHFEVQHKEIFQVVCFICKLKLHDPTYSCEVCSSVYHSECEVAADRGSCELCYRAQKHTQQQDKYKLTRLKDACATVCPQCGREVKNLASHINVHHLGLAKHKPAQCHICTKIFTQKAHLKEHIKSVHEQIKEFRCKFCEREFYRKTNFKRHMKAMHMSDSVVGGAEVECEECGRSFKNNNSLYKHRRVVHQGVVVSKKVYCDECGQSFTQSGSLYSHMRKVHSREPEIARNRQNNMLEKLYVDTDIILEVHPELAAQLQSS